MHFVQICKVYLVVLLTQNSDLVKILIPKLILKWTDEPIIDIVSHQKPLHSTKSIDDLASTPSTTTNDAITPSPPVTTEIDVAHIEALTD